MDKNPTREQNQGARKNPAASAILITSLLAFGCTTPLKPNPHYTLGAPYQADPLQTRPYPTPNVWYYPRETFDLDETGLAAIIPNDAPRLTTDGEVFDQTALAGAHPTIQLPAIARLTNLENGREVIIRLNDRGAGDPHRLLEITSRTAQLLAMPPGGVARVRLRVMPNESHAAAEALPGAPSLGMTAAPRDGVEVAELAPPPGFRQGGGRALPVATVVGPARPQAPAPPLRLPEAVIQTVPNPGSLIVLLDTFDEYAYASVQRARMTAAGARIVNIRNRRKTRFRVEIGPLPDVAHAESVLDKALASGIPDARIVIN